MLRDFFIQDVNAFIRSSSSSGTGNARNMFDKSSHPVEIHVSPQSASAASLGLAQEGFPPLLTLSNALGNALEEGGLLPPSANEDRVVELLSKFTSTDCHPIKSSIVAQADRKTSFSLDYFPPSPLPLKMVLSLLSLLFRFWNRKIVCGSHTL